MEVAKYDYKMAKFDQENVEILLRQLGLNTEHYFGAMTKPSNMKRMLVGNVADFSNRYCIVSFDETQIHLIMFGRLDTKKVTEIFRINRAEISKIKLSNILISYMLHMKADGNKLKFQVFKIFGKFNKIKSSIELFKTIYCQ
ncbi:MAG: hypothetical protein IKN54_05050 [Lachnospiraceae bacterium]|nr:hypothetical protein [Lachnospiraceae bacterium]